MLKPPSNDGLSPSDYIAQAESWEALERNKKAIECYGLALERLHEAASKNELILRADCHRAVGTQWRLLGKLKQTGEHYQKAISDLKGAYGDEKTLALGEMYFVLGSFLEQIWKLELAATYYTLALEELLVCLGEGHPYVNKVREKIAFVEELSPL